MNKRLISTLMVLLGTALTVSGCEKKNKQEQNEQQEKQTPKNVVDFIDFEEFEPDFQLLRLEHHFGKVSVNEDKNYVKSGEKSAKLQPLGTYANQNEKPFLYFELESEKFNYSYGDLDYLYSMTLWIYNVANETKEMDVGVVTAFKGIGSVNQDGGETYYLKNGWNKVTYFIDAEELYMPGGGNKAPGLYLEFANIHSKDLNDAPVFYIDDVSLKLKPEKKEIAIADNNIGIPVQGETIFVPKATIEGGEVSFEIYHNDLAVQHGPKSFVASEGGDYKIVYQASVDGFLYKKTLKFFVKPTKTVSIVDLNYREDLNRLPPRNTVIENVEYLDQFEGEAGVAKFTINRDWPAIWIDAKNKNVSDYDGCEYFVLRVYFQSGQNEIFWMKLNDQVLPEGYKGYFDLDQWLILKFPIAPFLNTINSDPLPWLVGNSTEYRYFGYFYIAEIFAM